MKLSVASKSLRGLKQLQNLATRAHPCPTANRQHTLAANVGKKVRGKQKRDVEMGLALHRAVQKQDAKTTELLLEASADPDARPSWETPAIVKPVKHTNIQMLKLPLRYGPNLEADAPGCGTELYTAVTKGNSDIVKSLLAHGADLNKRPSCPEPILCKAVSKQYNDIVELLLQQDNLKLDDTSPVGTTTVFLAAKKGNVQLVKRLVEGANVDARPMGTITAMFEAAKKGNFEVCKVLLENGAKVDSKTTGGDTALWNVVGKKYPKYNSLAPRPWPFCQCKRMGGL
ncbi:MAG: hypothetical protein Q9166_007309 [cf. Caloplaca sp. 2 TL-2023]